MTPIAARRRCSTVTVGGAVRAASSAFFAALPTGPAGSAAAARCHNPRALASSPPSLRDMAGLEQDRRVVRRQRQRLADRRLGALAGRPRGPPARPRNTRRTGPRRPMAQRRVGELGPRGLEVVLRFGRAGAVEQRPPALVGEQPGPGQRLVERQRRLGRLARRDPHVAGRGEHAVGGRVARLGPPGGGLERRGGLGELAALLRRERLAHGGRRGRLGRAGRQRPRKAAAISRIIGSSRPGSGWCG